LAGSFTFAAPKPAQPPPTTTTLFAFALGWSGVLSAAVAVVGGVDMRSRERMLWAAAGEKGAVQEGSHRSF